MNFILNKIQFQIRKGVNLILELEKKEKIRNDIIEIYRVCVIPENSPLKIPFFSQNIRYYYEQLLFWRLCAKNFDIKKSTEIIHDVIDNGESICDVFTLIDTILTIVAVIFPTIFLISIIENWHPLISLFFLFFSLLILLYKGFIKSLYLFRDEIQYLNENLVIVQDDIKYGSAYYGKKDSIIAAYIWNRSLCNSSIISSIIFLLLIKAISKTIYKRIYDSMVWFIPNYMPEFVKDKRRIKLLQFIISHRQKISKQK